MHALYDVTRLGSEWIKTLQLHIDKDFCRRNAKYKADSGKSHLENSLPRVVVVTAELTLHPFVPNEPLHFSYSVALYPQQANYSKTMQSPYI